MSGNLAVLPDTYSQPSLKALALLEASSAAPVPRLFFEEGAHGTQISLVPEEVGLFLALTPELEGIREGVHRLRVSADEGASEVDARQAVYLRLQVSNLADVVAYGVQQGPRDVSGREPISDRLFCCYGSGARSP